MDTGRFDKAFKIFVKANEDVPVDCNVDTCNLCSRHTCCIGLNRNNYSDPIFTTDFGCELLGKIEISRDTYISLEEQKHKTMFMFGDTELHVFCEKLKTGNVETHALDLSK
ncbi:hypothetical protein DPMN_192788 [Dreissena polymorpha]|uniref:Uncharacterized protein n=1 Tax=Dreissena polymorpha TaxID=45954 RepID=A0A9D3Y1K9_DREPO|nr:hypothetical protein DPMN_192788 [Dreissena polymorpha]